MSNNGIVVHHVESEDWWGQLTKTEQHWVKKESVALAEDMLKEVQTKISIGQHLQRLQEILQPKGLFLSFIKRHFSFSRATAYRRIGLYEKVSAGMSKETLAAVIANGHDITEIQVSQLPSTDNTEEILSHLNKTREMPKRKTVTIEHDRRVVLREALNFVESRVSRLAKGARISASKELCSMILASAGVTSVQAIMPTHQIEARRPRGRPRKKQLAA